MGSDQPARPPTSPASREDRSEKHKDEAEADPVRDSEDRMKQELANMEKKIDELKTLLQEK